MVTKITRDRFTQKYVVTAPCQCTVSSSPYMPRRLFGVAVLLLCVFIGLSSSAAYANDIDQDSATTTSVLDNKRIFFAPDERVSRNRKSDEENNREINRVPPDPEVLVSKQDTRPKVSLAAAPRKRLHNIHYQARLVIGDVIYFVVNNIPCEPSSMEGAKTRTTAPTLLCHGLDAKGYRLRVSKDAQSLLVMKEGAAIGTLVPGQTL